MVGFIFMLAMDQVIFKKDTKILQKLATRD